MTDGSLALEKRQPKIITIAPSQPNAEMIRVAAYIRVSSASEDQLNSFAAQNQYYTDLIAQNKNWELIDIYMDEGITGTSAVIRKGFQHILAAINSVMSRKEILIRDIMSAMEAETSPVQKDGLSITDVDTRLEEIGTQTRELIAAAAHDPENEDYIHQIRVLSEEAADLKKYRTKLTQYAVQRKEHDSRSEVIETVLEQVPSEITEWDESMICQLVETVKVISKTQIIVCLKNGSEIEQTITY